MSSFLTTAYRYLKGESGLPSILPAREVVEKAREKSRRVLLFCQGLEKFREILYTEEQQPVVSEQVPYALEWSCDLFQQDEGTASKGLVEDEDSASPVISGATIGAAEEEEKEDNESAVKLSLQKALGPDSPCSVGSGVAMGAAAEEEDVESPVEQSLQQPNGAGDIGTQRSTDKELALSTDCTQDQEHVSSPSPSVEMKSDQKPRKYVLSTSEDLFQSFHPTQTTPPASPGGASSCSTLVDPSRKVSPSDSKVGTEAISTAVKDFAYPFLDSNHVRDPVSIVDDNIELELARQMKKKTAGEKKAYRKAKKQKARDLLRIIELGTAEKKSQSGRADIASANAFATELSESSLRCVNDRLEHVLSHEQHGVQVQRIRSAVETTLDQQTGGLSRIGSDLQNALIVLMTLRLTIGCLTCSSKVSFSMRINRQPARMWSRRSLLLSLSKCMMWSHPLR